MYISDSYIRGKGRILMADHSQEPKNLATQIRVLQHNAFLLCSVKNLYFWRKGFEPLESNIFLILALQFDHLSCINSTSKSAQEYIHYLYCPDVCRRKRSNCLWTATLPDSLFISMCPSQAGQCLHTEILAERI